RYRGRQNRPNWRLYSAVEALFSARGPDQILRQFIHAIFGDARHIDATVVDHVDRILDLEPLNDIAGQPEQAEHPRMLGDEIEIRGVRLAPDRLRQLDAPALHALAHVLELGGPFGAQVLVLGVDAHALGALVAGLADGPSDDILHVARSDIGSRRVPGDGDRDAGAVAIQTEI